MSSSAFKKLDNFLRNKMRMSHIYQPVMLMKLLKNGGKASPKQIALSLLEKDQSQIEYYEEIVKRMVGDVLTKKNKITEMIKEGDRVKAYQIPNYEDLSDDEKRNLIEVCQSKIDDYIRNRGEKIWQHRKKSSGYISGTIQYEVLKQAKFRCVLCGTSADEKALEVDHIIPRNNGGSDDISNLQALCYSCNAKKRDRDATDFRSILESYEDRKEDCIFCNIKQKRIIASNELCYAIRDKYEVSELHTLIIPKRHVADYFELYQPEINAVNFILHECQTIIKKKDPSVDGFNIGVNCGETAGQTVFHCHVHIIPRRRGDVEDPRGGVRGVIPSKRTY